MNFFRCKTYRWDTRCSWRLQVQLVENLRSLRIGPGDLWARDYKFVGPQKKTKRNTRDRVDALSKHQTRASDHLSSIIHAASQAHPHPVRVFSLRQLWVPLGTRIIISFVLHQLNEEEEELMISRYRPTASREVKKKLPFAPGHHFSGNF